MIGTINLGTSEPDRGYTASEVRLAEALGRLVGVAVEGVRAREDLEREHERARAALELTGSGLHSLGTRARPVGTAHGGLMRLVVAWAPRSFVGGLARLSGAIGPPRTRSRWMGHSPSLRWRRLSRRDKRGGDPGVTGRTSTRPEPQTSPVHLIASVASDAKTRSSRPRRLDRTGASRVGADLKRGP
jgi:hypothetical protein